MIWSGQFSYARINCCYCDWIFSTDVSRVGDLLGGFEQFGRFRHARLTLLSARPRGIDVATQCRVFSHRRRHLRLARRPRIHRKSMT